jgi:hypothetical protein
MKIIFRICFFFLSFSKISSYLQLNSNRKFCFYTSIVEPLDNKFIEIISSGRLLPLLTTTIEIKEKDPQPEWKYVLKSPLIILRFVRSFLFKILIAVKYPFDRIFKKSPQVALVLPPIVNSNNNESTDALDTTVNNVNNEELTWKNFRSSVSNQLNVQEAKAAKEVIKFKFSMEEIAHLPMVSESKISSLHSTFNSLPEVTARDVVDTTNTVTDMIIDITESSSSDYEHIENSGSVTIDTPMVTIDPNTDDAILASNTLPTMSVFEESLNSSKETPVASTDMLTSPIIQPNENGVKKERKITNFYKVVEVEDLLNGDDNFSPANATLSSKLKSAGTSGVISYALTELAFWTISIPIIIASYHSSTDEWLNISNENDRLKIVSLTAGFATVARLAVPVRFALAVAFTPFIEKNVLPKSIAFTSKEKFNLKDIIQSIMSFE